MKNKTKLIAIIAIVVLLAAAAVSYFIFSNRQQNTALLTYQSETAPFTFDYPESWSLSETTDSSKSLIEYKVITAVDKQTDKKAIDIKYYTYVASTKIDNQDCKLKQGEYANECSYIDNPLMKNGYFYHDLDTDSWKGEANTYKTVDDERVFNQTVSITLTLHDNDKSSEDSLIKLAESIKPVEN